jgi:hypothetical protein
LYWCETADHDEDWFVVARSARCARCVLDRDEGYAPGDATAERVCTVPADHPDAQRGWPSNALIRACGGVLLKSPNGVRLVRLGDRVFGEGDIVGNVELQMGRVRRH